MKLWGICRFELGYQLRRPWPWLCFAILLGVDFLMARDTAVADAMFEDLFVNSSFAVAKTTVVGTLLWMLVAPVIAGEAGARDVATGMHPLAYTSSVSRTEYLGGRFLAALLLNALILLAVPAGILLAVYSPGVSPEVIGPFRPAAFLTAYAYIAVANAIVATAIQFSLAVWTGRPMASYLGSMLLIFEGFFVATVVRFVVSSRLGMLLDPVGINFIVEDLAEQWTVYERKWRVLGLEGTVLSNRLLWVGVGVATLAANWLTFRFAHRTQSAWLPRWLRRRDARAPGSPGAGVAAGPRVALPRVARTFGLATQARQTLAIARASFRAIVTSLAGLVLLVAVPLMTVPVVLSQMQAMGTPLVPTTSRVLRELTGGLSAELAAEPVRWVIVPLLIVFFAGELVWREREAGLGELTDTAPRSEWPPFLGKLLGLGLVLVVFMALLAAAGMVAQALLGRRDFEVALYLKVLFGLQLPEYLLVAVLALAMHVVVDQKYLGHLAAVLAYAFIAALAKALHVEHNLLVYASGPAWSYTDMRGFGASLGPWAWFKLYWAAWAMLLAVAARLLWVRGREHGLRVRLREARHRLAGGTARAAAAAAALIISLGGFIFYNTNVRNEYYSSARITELRAEYERRYRRYERAPQPRLAGAMLRVEIHPRRRAVEIGGSYRLVNAAGRPIDSVHVATSAGGAETGAITFDRPARLVLDDAERGYRIYALGRPLAPGDTLRLDFTVRVERHGFGNRGVDRSVAAAGSYFTSQAWFPLVGYQRSRELLSPADRREHGLAPRAVLASLYDVEGEEPASRGGGVSFDAVVGTDVDQVAVAPGALRRTWTEGGRRYFHYVTDAPIGQEWPFFSARYAVRESEWVSPRTPADSVGWRVGSPPRTSADLVGARVGVRIYHDPRHTAHLDRMMRSVRASLDYYTAAFGPYPYHHLTIVEHPLGPGTGAHADASLISYGQGMADWIPKDDTGRVDVPYFVVAHEVAHEWTVPYALVEGLPFLSEGLATYSAMQVVKASRGEEQFRLLGAFLRRPYPYRPIRRGEPLLRALDAHLSRRRGPFAMYALCEYMGADRVNGAVRRLIERTVAPGAPPATTLDLYRDLQAATPDSLRYLLHDLFEINALWELTTTSARADSTAAGPWRVTIGVRARKTAYDTAGVVTEMPMDEWVPVGVFAAPAPGHDSLSAPLDVRMHRVRSGEQTITVTVPRRPTLAGVDPYHLLDWEEPTSENNVRTVETGRPGNPRPPTP